MTNLITEARELIEYLHDGRWEYERIDYCAYEKLVALCDALEKATAKNDELIRELSQLARESVERDKALAKLEAEVMALRDVVCWIPVTERLPEIDKLVLVCFSNNKVFIGHRLSWANHGVYAWDVFTSHGTWTENQNDITHWMPLPAPPEEGE